MPAPRSPAITRPSQCPKECHAHQIDVSPRRHSRRRRRPHDRLPQQRRWRRRRRQQHQQEHRDHVRLHRPRSPTTSSTVVKPWAQKNGITVKFSPTANFNQLINTRVQGNQLPDVAIFPQPGDHARHRQPGQSSRTCPASSKMDDLKTNMVPGALEAGQGRRQAVRRADQLNVKSIVYYPKKAAAGRRAHTAPQTMDDLIALSDKIAATGDARRGASASSSGAATGWPATDWVEDLMLIELRRRRLQPVGHPQDPVQRPEGRRRPRPDGEADARRRDTSTAAGKSIARQQLRHGRQPDVRQPARLLHVPAGQLPRQPASSRTRSSRPIWTTPSASSRCPARRRRTSRCWAAVTWPGSSARQRPGQEAASSTWRPRSTGTARSPRSGSYMSPRTDVDLSQLPEQESKSYRADRPEPGDGVRSSTVPTRCRARSARAPSGGR